MEAANPSTVLEEVDALAGDSDFGSVFRLNYARIARVIARMIEDPGRAEELAAEVLWRFWQTRATHGMANAWLYRTAVHSGLDELRRQRRRRKIEELLDFRKPNPTPEELHHTTQMQRQVRNVLSILKRREAELLILRSEGFSYQEISEIVRMNVTSVGTLLRRAQQAFRKEYVRRYGE
jgi:RNA polymerase sigma-70 factor (ECF subfamily)